MYVCMHVCIHVCMYVFIYIYIYVSMYVCMDVCMYVWMYVCMYVRPVFMWIQKMIFGGWLRMIQPDVGMCIFTIYIYRIYIYIFLSSNFWHRSTLHILIIMPTYFVCPHVYCCFIVAQTHRWTQRLLRARTNWKVEPWWPSTTWKLEACRRFRTFDTTRWGRGLEWWWGWGG